MMTIAEFKELRKTGKNFKITPGGEVSFNEVFCTVINDGKDPFKMDLDDATISIILNFVFKVFLPVRKAFGKSLKISSGIRSFASYNRLISKGYNPSKTSDHFFGQNINGSTTSAGAFDLVPSDNNVDAFFEFLKKHLNRKNNTLVFGDDVVQFGQIIIEQGINTKWVHLSGDRTIIHKWAKPYSMRVCMSPDNGKTYKAL